MLDNVNFGSLKIIRSNSTKNAIEHYADCMDTIRVMADSFDRIKKDPKVDVTVVGKVVSSPGGDSILFESLKSADNTSLAKISVSSNDFITSRAELFQKFCNETLENLKKLIK